MDVVYYVVGFSLTIIGMVSGALYWLGAKFKEIENRLRDVDSRFERLEREMRLGFEDVSKRDADLKGYIDRRIDRLLQGFASYQEFFVEFLAAEGVTDKRSADLARGELWRVVKLAGANPLTREEVERLKALIEKEELTYDEAVWLRDVARRLILEYGTPETWKLHIYASIWVALARRKEEERGQKSVSG
ncbi:hypothetical protein ODS41_06895 [Pyrobaculum sp. 3827-6]|uniref:hypothetical protein n=1 Tax=Pyrobaculum sp. 3827-6 TaxID=2983604 RepID=UPI0021DA79C1|nr:hypothetical protein [Pyrobaculum sp. 3827-6]MCU7787642.1 hypothetical protein [Pyrobaculum sp. 3827-6]